MRVPRFAAGGFLIDGGRVLLGKRATSKEVFPGRWDVPGGRSEGDETPEQTLVRELFEEVGVIPRELRLLKVIPPDDPAEHLPLYLFAITRWDGAASNLQEHEHTELAWCTPGEAAALPLAFPEYPDLIRELLRGNSAPGSPR
jgi:8-oxo-dGTP diphosphatase